MGRRSERSTALSHTQRISGSTSQLPLARTPPQGPLRSVFGHVSPVSCSTHWPHIRHPHTGFLTACSALARRSAAFTASPLRRDPLAADRDELLGLLHR